jgi:hypothetical protein
MLEIQRESQVVLQRRILRIALQQAAQYFLGVGETVLGNQHRGHTAARRRMIRMQCEATLETREGFIKAAGLMIEIAQLQLQRHVLRVDLQIFLVATDAVLLCVGSLHGHE